MNLHYLLLIPLFIAGLAVGCADVCRYPDDLGQTFSVKNAFRISANSSVTRIVVEGHQYMVYATTIGGGGIVHSASCAHPVHGDMRDIY